MKLTINTAQLQGLVAKSVKGASCNKMIPITSMMAIERKDSKITLITTDANNYLLVSADCVGEDFYAVVPVVLFSQLVAKLTSETVTLVFDESGFVVKANGDYKIELPLDENGDYIKFPTPYADVINENRTATITLEEIKSILRVNKAALATTLEVPCYTGYYVADRVVSTDTYKLCGNNIKVIDTPILVAPETMSLLDIMSEAEIDIIVKDNIVVFRSYDCIVYGNLMYGIDNYQVDAITSLLDDKFDHVCVVQRNLLLEALDRIGLFVGPYDNNVINMHFGLNVIEVSNQQSYSHESIPCNMKDAIDYNCAINIELLESQIKAQQADEIEIHYGKPNAIKIVSGNVVQVIALGE